MLRGTYGYQVRHQSETISEDATVAALRHSAKRIRAAVTGWRISVVGRVNALRYVADDYCSRRRSALVGRRTDLTFTVMG